MPFKDPAKKRAYDAEYRATHKLQRNAKQRAWRQKMSAIDGFLMMKGLVPTPPGLEPLANHRFVSEKRRLSDQNYRCRLFEQKFYAKHPEIDEVAHRASIAARLERWKERLRQYEADGSDGMPPSMMDS